MTVNNCSMTVNYCSILTQEIIGFFTAVIYHGILLQYFYDIGPTLKYILQGQNTLAYSFWILGKKMFDDLDSRPVPASPKMTVKYR